MLNKEIKICKILTFSEEDFLYFNLEFSCSGVDIILMENNIFFKYEEHIPTIIVGWSNVKKLFPNQRISKRNINNNLFWVYNIKEDKSNSLTESKNIIKSIMSKWLPENYITYDYVLDGGLSKLLLNNLTKPYDLYLYFSGKAMYLYNSKDKKKTIGISLESIKYCGIDVRELVSTIIEKYSPICFSYSNVSPYLPNGRELFFETIGNVFWAKHFEEISEKNFYDFMMDVESCRFIPFIMSELYNKQNISKYEKTYIKRLNKKDIITDWLSKKELFFNKKYENEKIKFKKSYDGMKYVKLLYSNKKTITGRINCIDRNFNPQMLPKDSKEREMIISRFKEGKIAVFDYISFETKLSLFLSQNKEFIEKYKDKDLHIETAKVIFNKNNLSSEERKIGKSINHTLIYGGGDEVLKKILQNLSDYDSVILKVRNFLNPILELSEQIKFYYEDFGYVINSFGTIVKPQKKWAAFHNFIQSIAADIMVEKLYIIKEYLINKKSKFIFQNHDSFVFDIHKDETIIIEEIKNILSDFKDIKLQIQVSCGNNLNDCC